MSFCKKCNNSGSTTDEGYLDCLDCDVAIKRAEFDKWLSQNYHGASGIKDWAIYCHASRTADERVDELEAKLAAAEARTVPAQPGMLTDEQVEDIWDSTPGPYIGFARALLAASASLGYTPPDWCPECHARESTPDSASPAAQEDARIDWRAQAVI